MRDAEVHDEVDRPRGVREEGRQLNTSTPLTPAAGHLGGCYLGGCLEEVRNLIDCRIMLLLGTAVTSADMITDVNLHPTKLHPLSFLVC